MELSESGLDALAESGLALGLATSLSEALKTVVEAMTRAVGADAVVARIADEPQHRLITCAVATGSPAAAAELEGSWLPLDEVPESEESELERLPQGVRRAAERVGASQVLFLPVHVDGQLRGSLELMRSLLPFDDSERRLARVAAAQAGLAVRAFGGDGPGRPFDAQGVLRVAGDALAAGADESRTAEEVARLAAEATGAMSALLWRLEPGEPLDLVASFRPDGLGAPAAEASAAVERALAARQAVIVEGIEGVPVGEAGVSATLTLGQPVLGALQLLFTPPDAPTEEDLAVLATFGVRAAHALRASRRSRTIALELDRTRALLAIVGQAISQLSLSHTLETAVARVAELLGAERLAVYLREGDRLYAAAGLGLAGPHVLVADRLLELTLGPFRSRGVLVVRDVRSDPRLSGVGDAAAEAGIEAVIAVPLLAHDDVVGLLGVFPELGAPLDRERIVTRRGARCSARGRRSERAAARAGEAPR